MFWPARDRSRGTRSPDPTTHRAHRGSLRFTVQLLVGVLVGLLVVCAGVTGVARLTVAAAEDRLSSRMLPAREAAADLAKAYVDQETGQRGFLLTGAAESLRPYDAGRAQATRLHRRLADLLRDDARALDLLQSIGTAAANWQDGAAEPEIAARRQGPIPADQLATMALSGETLFDALRVRLDALERRTAQLTAAQLARIDRAQGIANAVALASVALAVLVALGSIPLLRRRLARPLGRLLSEVQAVAGGAYDQPISTSGPHELALVGESVDRMRESIVQHTAELVATQRELTLREEHDRLASDLHDLAIQRIFALGLRLSSLARRSPQLAAELTPLIEETDRIIREVRTVIFDLGRAEVEDSLRGQVIDLTEESVRALGFTPALEFSGPVDTLTTAEVSGDLLAVLREALSNVARHAGASEAVICLSTDDGSIVLTVSDNGIGIDPAAARGNGLTNLQSRAARLGGTATVTAGPAGTGTVVEWRVPVAAPSP